MNAIDGNERWPTEIRANSLEKRLEVEFDDGAVFSIPAELLRVESPSAEVQGLARGVASERGCGVRRDSEFATSRERCRTASR